MRERVERALRELPLSEADIISVASQLCDSNLLFQNSPPLNSDSAFFDFHRKVTAVVEHFASDGLTLEDYLKAAVKQPQLFSRSPATIINNIESVAEHFRDQGLTVRNYLAAAVKQPPLFCQSPVTLIGHVNLIIDLVRQGLIHVSEQADTPANLPLRPIFDFLIRNPRILCLADDNFTLREIYAHATGNRPSGAGLLTQSRCRVEQELAEALGHADQDAPIPKETSPREGGDPDRHARNLLLRALIREGMVRGTLQR